VAAVADTTGRPHGFRCAPPRWPPGSRPL